MEDPAQHPTSDAEADESPTAAPTAAPTDTHTHAPITAPTHAHTDESIKEVFANFLEHTPGGIFRYSAEEPDVIDFASQELINMMGCTDRADFDALTGGCFKGIVHPADRERTINSINEQITHGADDAVVYRLNRKDGRELWVDDRGHIVTDSAGKKWFYVTVVDITEQIHYEREMQRAHERMEILTALSNDIVFDIECGTGHAQVFGDFEDRFGREPRQDDFVVKRRCHKECNLDIHANGLGSLLENITEDSLVDFETYTEGPDGEPVWYRYQSVVLYDDDGNAIRHVGRLLDTHDMMMRESQFRRKAEHDSLTGLYNRSAALNRIETALKADNPIFTFFLIDVDDFKAVNDTYGHPEGDRVLTELATFLVAAMRQEDVVARLGGDEFAVFAKGLSQGPALERIMNHLVRGPFATQRATDDGKHLKGATPSITIGVVCGEGGAHDFEEIYATADEALYEAKQQGKAKANLKILS